MPPFLFTERFIDAERVDRVLLIRVLVRKGLLNETDNYFIDDIYYSVCRVLDPAK